MRKTMTMHRFLSLALCLCLCLSLLPVAASAATDTVADWAELAEKYGTDGGKTITIPTGTTVTVTDTLVVPDGEYTLTGGGTLKRGNASFEDMIIIYTDAKLTLEDMTLDGANITGRLDLVWVFGGEFTMTGGSIKNSAGTYGGVFDSGTFTMTGGSVTDNTYHGVCVYDTFHMSGGSITGNTGAGVYVDGTFYVSRGATVTGNTDNAAPCNVILVGSFITVTDELTGSIGITAESGVSPAVVAMSDESYTITADDLAHLSSDSGTTLSLNDDGNVEMVTPLSIRFATVTLEGLEEEGEQYFTTYNGQTQKPTAVTVENGDKTLTEGTDYTWKITSDDTSYEGGWSSSGKNAGWVEITITGRGAYQGSAEAAYFIAPKALTVTGATIKDSVYASNMYPEVESVTFDGLVPGETLKPDMDYAASVHFENPEEPEEPVNLVVGVNAAVVAVDLYPTPKAHNYAFFWDGDLRVNTTPATWTITPAPLIGTVLICVDEDNGTVGILDEGDVLAGTGSANVNDDPNIPITAFQWYRNGSEISGATGMSYTITAEDANADITVRMTATGYYVGTLTSAPVRVGKHVLRGDVQIVCDVDDPTTDDTLTLNLSDFPENAAYSIRWYRDGAAISGATGDTYTLTKADMGKLITVLLDGTGDYAGAVSNVRFIPPIAPDAPVLRASAGDGQVVLSWAKPYDGGIRLEYYFLEVWEGGPEDYNDLRLMGYHNGYLIGPSATGYTVAGLKNGTEYSFMIHVWNAMGDADSNIVTVTPTAGGGYVPDPVGDSPTTPAQTIPAADGAVAVSYTQKGETVILDLPAAKVAEIIKAAEGGTAIFDLSGVADAGEAVIPASALKALAEAGLDVEIKLPEGTVTLDGGTLATAVAGGGNVTVSVSTVKPETLTDAQRAQLRPGDVVIDISLMAGTTVIHALNGTVTVTVPYDGELPAAVWYLNDAGELEKLACSHRNGFVTFTIDHLSLYVIGQDTAWQNPFTDVAEGAWYYDAVRYVYENGVMQGAGGSLFEPGTNLSRAMMVQILYNIEGRPASGNVLFDDVSGTAWYADAVAWAAENEIVNGVGNNLFAPDAPVTREELVTMLYRYIQSNGGGFEGPWMFLVDFDDRSDIADWAYEAVCYCTISEIVTGKPGKLFDPQGTATRAEAATVLYHFMSAN